MSSVSYEPRKQRLPIGPSDGHQHRELTAACDTTETDARYNFPEMAVVPLMSAHDFACERYCNSMSTMSATCIISA